MYKKILVGIDNSELSLKAVAKAIELHKTDKSEIVVFHSVLQKIGDLSPAFGQTVNPGRNLSYDLHQDRIKAAEKLLDDVKTKFEKENVPVETRLELYIGPQYYIENQVEEEGFDLVLLGCNGEHSKFRRTFLGTVPEHVLNNANCDVLIVK
ncbi:MAG: universal stress protein [Promethearchaeota archaeon]|jgi:nucleotide-binding universal stress UspA family protein